MNLAESLREVLPEPPAARPRARLPRLHPDLIFRRDTEDSEPVVVAMVRGSDKVLRFTPAQWQLVELFDGVRDYDDVANQYAARYGTRYDAADLRDFVAELESTGVWHSSSLERHAGHRHRTAAPSRWADISHIQFTAWDPDRYFDRIYPHLRWIYTRWFTTLTVLSFVFVLWIWVAHWSQLSQDNLAYLNFTSKSGSDLAEFWALFLVVGFVHESAHGLTCKHYGGQVHKMGFHLVYLLPAFFVDVTEGWVYASRWQRLAIIIAGVWSELLLSVFASFVWWGTPTGSDVHDIAYKMILLNGIFVLAVNLNPLVKLDGYYAFSEIVGFADIKEKSTAYLSSVVRSTVFRLPGEVQHVPRKRRWLFILYAVVSGVYSYGLLLAFVLFSYRVASRFFPLWGFLVPALLGVAVFRSRLKLFASFMRLLYLDKRERLGARLRSAMVAGPAAAVLLLAFLPIWHESVTVRFVLEPGRMETVRTLVAGRVTEVFVGEGSAVRSGEELVQMGNLHLESQRHAEERTLEATGFEGARSLLLHQDLASVQQRYRQASTEVAIANEQLNALTTRAPFSGIVLTPHVHDLLGTFLTSGSPIAEIADTHEMRARLYILDYAFGRVTAGLPVHLLLDGTFSSISARIGSVEPSSHSLPDALEAVRKLDAGAPLQYYVANVELKNGGRLRAGMVGTAKIVTARASLATIAWHNLKEFVQRKVW